jgi:serine protein kinase
VAHNPKNQKSGGNKKKTSQFHEMFKDVRSSARALTWEGTFAEYLDMVIQEPSLARLSHKRISDMIDWTGISHGLPGNTQYKLFKDHLFGIERPLEKIVKYFNTAGHGWEVRKRILLLLGPPSSGKSTIVGLIRKGLELYSQSDAGALYAIKGCPMQEEPLHLVPDKWRDSLSEDHNINIEGSLCPRCRFTLDDKYNGDIEKMPVTRVVISESAGLGMGMFVATAPESQDMDRLIGSVDLDNMADNDTSTPGKIFRLDGELESANRGLIEFAQIFKSDDRFLTILLSATQEQQVKLGNIGSVHIDETIIALSNEEEYRSFIKNPETEALLDRLILVPVPYNLKISSEIKTFNKLLSEGKHEDVHISPLTFPLTALLTVLSRLDKPPLNRGFGGKRLSLIDKAKLYNNEFMLEYDQADVEALRTSHPREGLFGLSPRYVINQLGHAMSASEKCLLPLPTVQSIVEGTYDNPDSIKEEQNDTPDLIPDLLKEFKQMVLHEIQKASVEVFSRLTSDLFESYIRNLERFSESTPDADTWVLSTIPVDEQIMHRAEDSLGIRDNDRTDFRNHVYTTYQQVKTFQNTVTLEDIPALHKAIELAVSPTITELKLILPEQLSTNEEDVHVLSIKSRLTSKMGYCEQCADDLLSLGIKYLHGNDKTKIKNGQISW